MRQKGFAHLVLLVVVGIVLAGGYLAYQKGYIQLSLNPNNELKEPVSQPTISTPVTQPTLASDEMVNWNTYTSADYKFSFKYPERFIVKENKTGDFVQVLINQNKDEEFYIEADKDYTPDPNSPLFFLDTLSNGERRIGNYVWETYWLPNGYGDGGGSQTQPARSLYGLQLETSGILYSVGIYGKEEPTQSQLDVLSTFKTTN